MRTWRPLVFIVLCAIVVMSLLLVELQVINVSANTQSYSHTLLQAAPPGKLQLDSRLPAQPVTGANNVNAKFGSRFDFVVSPNASRVYSGTDGVYHDTSASYIVGVVPTGSHTSSIFHMGTPDLAQGDSYVHNEQLIQGLDTSRWQGDASDGSGMHITVDIIDTFFGEPGCVAVVDCADQVRADTVPVFLIGVTLQNNGNKHLTGKFLFGSNRALPPGNACVQHTTAAGSSVNILSYSPASDATGGTLFMAGAQAQWQCNTSISDRAGLAWAYDIGATQSQTSYMLIGAWNSSHSLFINTQLPPNCQLQMLYPAREWSSENDVVDYATDNLATGDNLLGRAQAMEDMLIRNNALSPQQRWVIGDSLRSYKAMSWLLGRQDCAGGGYDAAVYEGSFGFLTTVDVLHEYGYFEINRVPWFFKSELQIVFKNAQRNAFGVYFQHDQGGDTNGQGLCTPPGGGIPTIRATCYAPPLFSSDVPMPTEEDSNVALLTAYYEYITGDTSLLTGDNNANLKLLDAGMLHNQAVGDPATGIAYNAQDTNTTYDDQSDCLHNIAPHAGNLYYQGLKEAAAYRATSYIDGLIPGDSNNTNWVYDASKIEAAMVREYNTHGFIPLAQNNAAYNNCNGRTVTTGEGLFYLHLIGLDTTMNPTLLQDLAQQYPADVVANSIGSPHLISLASTRASNPQCLHNKVCLRYEWFSKVMLSGIIADLVYTQHGCQQCRRLDVTSAAYTHNITLLENFSDGIRDDGSDWIGHYYPRGMISWAFLDANY
ncbi:MAG TPA: glycoside hydrolase family 52 protein [Ktedonobacteraceae bacterium]|nr:glycoside hydrolase family 52 protein [Ktedonobacteraceae bacterium]